MHPRISIITPSYNQGNYIEETILSVINQGYPDVEHIIIDGGSTDTTKEILEKYKTKLAYTVSEPDKGQSDAVNKGFAKATGEIVGWLNSDDYYAPGALQAVANAFADPTINAVTGYSILFDETGKQDKGEATVTPSKGLDFHLRFPDINQPATFFRRKAMAELMPLNTTLHYVMDREMWIKYIQQYGISHIKAIQDTLVYFRYHAVSKSTSKEPEFDTEYATLLHFFAVKNNLTEIAALLAEHYSLLANYTYSFPKYPDRETTLNMIRYFFLKRGGLVFEKNQFSFVKKMFPLLRLNEYTPLPEEENRMKRMAQIEKCVNWAHFKVKRKLHLF